MKANYKYKFKVCKLNDELIHIHELIKLDNKESEIENKLSSIAYELYWNIYECIKKLDIESPKISMFRNNFKDTDYNENKNNYESNPDKEKIRNVKKNLNELDSVID
ncbi:hypothetical protein IKN40_02235 [bacterium]|nr:hypothetical protein [bacterium]